MTKCPVIALTGGPGGGKTTLMRELRAADPHARRWLLVPEAAPLLFQAGLNGREKSFQRAVVRLQIALEDACIAATQPGQVLVCHRGTLDPLAYWLRNGWNERDFFDCIGLSCNNLLARYNGVIHLQTAALGAADYYRRWPDAHRPESTEQAAEIDRFCERAWNGHPHYVLIDNQSRDWQAKAEAAWNALKRWLE